MHVIDNDTFLSLAAKQGIALDSRYAEPRTLGFQNDFKLAVPMPTDVRRRHIALSLALGLFADEVPFWVWRRGGVWWFGDGSPANLAIQAVFSVAGVKTGIAGTLQSDGGEKGLLFAGNDRP
jgi:hypothetical protein